jgi:hybrid cluster-associated redox disulfide protein
MSKTPEPCDIDAATLVDALMRQRPETIGVFLRRKLHCVGCPLGQFHTIEEAAREHGLEPTALLADLRVTPCLPPA